MTIKVIAYVGFVPSGKSNAVDFSAYSNLRLKRTMVDSSLVVTLRFSCVGSTDKQNIRE